jgi:hypothetical protein
MARHDVTLDQIRRLNGGLHWKRSKPFSSTSVLTYTRAAALP